MDRLSHHSLNEADRDRSRPSEFGGAAGERASLTHLEREPVLVPTPADGFGPLEIDLSWDHLHQGKGVLGTVMRLMGQGRVDLDLGCLYELQDGRKGCLQAFGNLFGQYDAAPYIRHSGDERSGAAPGADESLSVNGAHWSDIKRILVYAYIYQGVPDWDKLRPVCTLRAGPASFTLRLDEGRGHLPIAALVTLENENGALVIKRRCEYFQGHLELDRAYGFGLNWEEGCK